MYERHFTRGVTLPPRLTTDVRLPETAFRYMGHFTFTEKFYMEQCVHRPV